MELQATNAREQDKALVNNIIEQASAAGAVKQKDYRDGARKSVLPGQGRESKIQMKLRQKREEKMDKEIKDVLDQALSIDVPIKNANDYINDVSQLIENTYALTKNESIQKAVAFVDEHAMAPDSQDEQAKSISTRLNIAIKAFSNDSDGAKAMMEDVKNRAEKLDQIRKEKGDQNGETLRAAMELDSTVGAGNWALINMLAQTTTQFHSMLQEAVDYTSAKQSTTDVNVVTDVQVKETKE